MTTQRIAVIGGVASGTAAAAEARRVDPDARIVLYEQGPDISYGSCEIPLFLAGSIREAEALIAFTPERFEREKGVEVHVNTRVDKIDPKAGSIHVTDLLSGASRTERFDKFILATGAVAFVPDLVGVIDGTLPPNVFTIRELRDAVSLDTFRKAHDIQHAVVAGGGYVGLEVAEALVKQGIRVSMVQSAPGPLHAQLGDQISADVKGLLEENGITVREDRMNGMVTTSHGNATAVTTDSGERIGCQLVVLALGIRPNTRLGLDAGVRVGRTGGFRVSTGMRTSVANVWACGDCVEVVRLIDDKAVLSPLSLTAFRTGRVAGRNAARRGTLSAAQFPGVVGSQGLRLFDTEMAYVGLTRAEAVGTGFSASSVTIRHRTRAALVPDSSAIEVTLVFDTVRGRLLGAQMIGGTGTVYRANVLLPLIRSGATVYDLYDQDLIYAPQFSPRLDPLLVVAKKAIDSLTAGRKT